MRKEKKVKEKKDSKEKKKNKDSELTDTLFHGMMEGFVVDMVMNAAVPVPGLAATALNKAKNIKRTAKVMSKGAAKEGIEMLDGEKAKGDPAEELSEDIALEVLSRVGGRGG